MVNITISAVIVLVIVSSLLLLEASSMTGLDFDIQSTAVAQTSSSSASTNTFEMDGQIGSLVLGMPPNTKTVDMTTVPKIIMSGDWTMDVNQGKTLVRAFIQVQSMEPRIIPINWIILGLATIPLSQLSPDKSVSLSGIVDVGINGNKAWDNVNATVDISKGRSITISLADEDTERHFMGQQIYGIVQGPKL
jgi:hypothetical protein